MDTVDKIKETLECFDAADAAADAVVSAAADGRLNLMDVPKLLKPMRAVKEALDGKDKIVGELKGADEADVARIVTRCLQLSEKMVLAFEAISKLAP